MWSWFCSCDNAIKIAKCNNLGEKEATINRLIEKRYVDMNLQQADKDLEDTELTLKRLDTIKQIAVENLQTSVLVKGP